LSGINGQRGCLRQSPLIAYLDNGHIEGH